MAEQNPPGRCQIELEGSAARISPLPGPETSLNGQALQGPGALGDGDLIEFADGSAWRLVAVRGAGDNGSQA